MITNFSTPPNEKQSLSSGATDPRGVFAFSVDPQTGEVTQEDPEVGARSWGADSAGNGRNSGSLVLNTGIASQSQKEAYNGVFHRVKRRFELQDYARKLLPGEKVTKCLRYRFNENSGVGVHFSERVKRAHYSNLITCGRPWVCPVCAAKITERRRVELAGAVDQWQVRANSLLLATFTMQHVAGEDLADLLRDMNNAFRELKSGRFWADFSKHYHIAGTVTAHEITYGQASGFHPHKHMLIFCEGEITILERCVIWFTLSDRWQAKLSNFGRTASNQVGLELQEGYGNVSDYVAKWGLVEEVTKANSKMGRSGKSKHFSPFQLLDLVSQGSPWAGPVFQAYAVATKGKNQLTWSPGLRDLFDLGKELSDLEIAEKQEEKAVLLLTLLWPQWRQVLKANSRAVLLEVASTGRADLVKTYLGTLGINLEDENGKN